MKPERKIDIITKVLDRVAREVLIKEDTLFVKS